MVEVLTDSPSPRQYWGVLKGRENQLLTFCLQLKLSSVDGKYYATKANGYSDDWIEKRVRGIAVRQELTDEWKSRGVQKEKDFAFFCETISIAKASEYGAD